MSKEFLDAFADLRKEKNLSDEEIIGAIKDSIENAYRKNYGASNVRVDVDMTEGNVTVYMGMEVVEEVEDDMTQISLDDAREIYEGYEIGDVVAVCPLYAKDGTTPGYTRDGGYGTMTTAPVEQLVKVPEGVETYQAAAATDAGATSYHALCSVGGAKEGTKVGIIGVGGLGQFAVSIAVAKGCEVYVATRKPSAQELALKLGAKEVKSNITEFTDKNLDLIVDFAGAGTTTDDALKAVKHNRGIHHLRLRTDCTVGHLPGVCLYYIRTK